MKKHRTEGIDAIKPSPGPVCLPLESEPVFAVELVNTSAGIDQLLLPGVERVALGADFNGDVLPGAAGLNDVASGAADRRRLIIGVDAFFHGGNLSCFIGLF